MEEQEGCSNTNGERRRRAETGADGEGGSCTEVERRSNNAYSQLPFPSPTKPERVTSLLHVPASYTGTGRPGKRFSFSGTRYPG